MFYSFGEFVAKTKMRQLCTRMITPLACMLLSCSTLSLGWAESSSVLKSTRYSLEILPTISTSVANQNNFATPMVYYRGNLFTVNVEQGNKKNNGWNLFTVVRKATKNKDGLWYWESSKVIDDQTIFDPWHTQPSIGLDKNGYLHIAYNMHNMPWQYVVSKNPGDINDFEFRGEKITLQDKIRVKKSNKIEFPSLGTASIPGNQVTYPAFFNDKNGELFITYRYATRPARKWQERAFAGGIAKYDTKAQTWESLGGEIVVTAADAKLNAESELAITQPFAFQNNWSVYGQKLSFDRFNHLHITWMWRKGGAGRYSSHPSYAYSTNGGKTFRRSNGSSYDLPISMEQSELYIKEGETLEFSTDQAFAVGPQGRPYMIVNPKDHKGRWIIEYDQEKSQWSTPQPIPYAAVALFIDSSGTQWAVATGPKIFKREKGNFGKWDLIIIEEGYGYPKILAAPETNGIFIHTHSPSHDKIGIYWLSTEAASLLDDRIPPSQPKYFSIKASAEDHVA